MEVSQPELTADLLQRAKAGDGPAFEALLAPVLDPAFRLAITMLGNRSTAEDVVQEAALKAWRSLERFRPGADLRPWFLAIVANECRSVRRSRWWQVVLSGDVASASWPDPLEVASADRLDLDAALERLPRRHLPVLVLYYHLDLPADEVGRVLGCSRNAARVRIHRALNALRPGMAAEVER